MSSKGEARETQCRGCRSKKACSNKQSLLPPEPARQQQPAPEPTQGSPEEEPTPNLSQETPPPPSLLGPFRDVPRTERARGGVLILTRKDVAFDPMPVPYRPVRDRTTYIGAVAIHCADKTLHIINIYSPPARWTEGQGTEKQNIEINRLNTPSNCIIVGDLNAHAATWNQHQCPSQLGIMIEDWTVDTGLMVLNDGSHTRVNPATGGLSTPDITLATPDVGMDAEWTTPANIGSDHLPIKTTLTATPPPTGRGRGKFCFRRADWIGFRDSLEKKMSEIDLDTLLEKLNRDITMAITTSARNHIPFGNGRSARGPFWNERCEEAVRARDAALEVATRQDRTREAVEAHQRARAETDRVITMEKKTTSTRSSKPSSRTRICGARSGTWTAS